MTDERLTYEISIFEPNKDGPVFQYQGDITPRIGEVIFETTTGSDGRRWRIIMVEHQAGGFNHHCKLRRIDLVGELIAVGTDAPSARIEAVDAVRMLEQVGVWLDSHLGREKADAVLREARERAKGAG